MKDNNVAVSRPLVGLLAICCLVVAGLIRMLAPDHQEAQLWLAGFIRVGLVMTAFWIALPSGDRPAAWANISRHTLIGIALGTLALLRLPFRVVLPVAVAVAVIGFVLRPRGKKRPQSRGPRDEAAMQPQPSEVIRTAEPDVARRQ
jgi:hypothetical protein